MQFSDLGLASQPNYGRLELGCGSGLDFLKSVSFETPLNYLVLFRSEGSKQRKWAVSQDICMVQQKVYCRQQRFEEIFKFYVLKYLQILNTLFFTENQIFVQSKK